MAPKKIFDVILTPGDSFNGENVCRIVDCPALRKVYSHKRSLGEHPNCQHTKIESRGRRTTTGASEPNPPFPILDVFEQQVAVILFKHPGSYASTIPDSQADSEEQFGATVIEGTDKTPEEVEEYLFLTPSEIWSTFAEQFELAINSVKEGKDSDEELMGRVTASENRLR
ncbi:hypothetical protein NW752_004294 [Fusarium irregulare]|nr:hypothetical protein NW752_004294 [Fusarium irregulare]